LPPGKAILSIGCPPAMIRSQPPCSVGAHGTASDYSDWFVFERKFISKTHHSEQSFSFHDDGAPR
jgi:hypothetical protein